MDTAREVMDRRASSDYGRRYVGAASWVLPGATLALIPKCPMCLAAYIAMFSGVALPFSTAAILRWTLIAICAGALAYLGLRKLQRFNRSRAQCRVRRAGAATFATPAERSDPSAAPAGPWSHRE